MKRTQIYMDELLHFRLIQISREMKTTISELIRRAAEKVYGKWSSPKERLKAFQAARGIWKDRTDFPPTQEYIRQLRKSTRMGEGQVSG